MPTVLITGANRGIGLELARAYAADGWRVHATARDVDGAAELRAVPGNVAIRPLDVDDAVAGRTLATAMRGEPIDLLLQNAGILGPRGVKFDQADDEVWMQLMRTNAMAPLRLSALLVDNVAASERRQMAFVSSKMGSIGLSTGGSYMYRSSKAALNSVVKTLAADLAPRGVTCVALHPGGVRTRMGSAASALDAPTSAAALKRVLDAVGPADNGAFINYDGERLPW
jgi:NAD(P)-dependent dehydrogenase (short-subunit alcohol dehydrogenase family)